MIRNFPEGDNTIKIGLATTLNGEPVITVGTPVVASKVNAETFVEFKLPTYKYFPVLSKANVMGPVPTAIGVVGTGERDPSAAIVIPLIVLSSVFATNRKCSVGSTINPPGPRPTVRVPLIGCNTPDETVYPVTEEKLGLVT